MLLDARQSEALLAVIETGSFEQAGQRLHLTPSAISQRIRALESELGTPLLIRARPCHPTPAGRRLAQYLLRRRWLDSEFQAELSGADTAVPLSVPLAVNNDTLASWLLPALADFLTIERLLLDITLDDREHTYGLLETGRALAAVSAEPHAMRGCAATPLGVMRYRLMATPAFAERWFGKGISRDAARHAPVVTFSRKDQLQANFLKTHFGLPPGSYPCHYVPASDPLVHAIALGLGYGMMPELQYLSRPKGAPPLIDLAPAWPVDVRLYWHDWQVQSPRLERLRKAVLDKTGQWLLP